jgi:S-adenosylmethionine synthetase
MRRPSAAISARWLWPLPAIRIAARTGDPSAAAIHDELRRAVREEGARWILDHVLVTLQQRPEMAFVDLCTAIAGTLEKAYRRIRRAERRWCAAWDAVELMLNPNGPLLNGGSEGDNGQTCRKLVMDYYGPRVPIGGGALYGKDPTHIDRVGARQAREMALREVRKGAGECMVRLTYAPRIDEPIDVCCSKSRGD